MSPRDLLRAAERAIRLADALGEQFSRALTDVFRETERQLPTLIHGATGGGSVQQATLAGALHASVRSALRRAGFDALALAAYDGDRLDPLVQLVLASRRQFGLASDLTPSMSLQLEALGALYQEDLLGEGDDIARQLWRAAVRGLFGGSSPDTILEDLGGVIDRTAPQIRTLYDTSVSILGRQVEALQAGDDPDALFAFVGPVDTKTRPWCLRHVGRLFTRAQIDELDNGQIAPVFLTGGGYNCRHLFSEISKASELRDLVGTDERIPEVQQDLDALKEAA